MTGKPKTIRRRKGWPKWARWYAEDSCGCGCIYRAMPSRTPKWKPLIHTEAIWWPASSNSRWKRVAWKCEKFGHKLNRNLAWGTSLRRIV